LEEKEEGLAAKRRQRTAIALRNMGYAVAPPIDSNFHAHYLVHVAPPKGRSLLPLAERNISEIRGAGAARNQSLNSAVMPRKRPLQPLPRSPVRDSAERLLGLYGALNRVRLGVRNCTDIKIHSAKNISFCCRDLRISGNGKDQTLKKHTRIYQYEIRY